MTTIDGFHVDLRDVPLDFVPCFNAQCPRCEQCVRYSVGQVQPARPQIGHSVYPQSLGRDGSCPYFYQLRVIREAWGFDGLFDEVKARDIHALRLKIEAYLGSHSSYYRYHHGELTLTPEQQEHIFQLFAKMGYDTSGLAFSHYRETVDYHAD